MPLFTKHIEKMVALSTAHLWPFDMVKLEEGEHESIIAYPHGEYGWLIVVPTDTIRETIDRLTETGEFTAHFRHILLAAYEEGAEWILFDRDARRVPGLPLYEDFQGG